jgi:hypothetical protein
MKHYLALIAFLFLGLLLGGCIGFGTYPVAQSFPAPTSPKNVRVFANARSDVQYDVLAYVSVYDQNAQNKGDELRDKLKEHASQLGADAIIAFKFNMDLSGGGGAQGIAIRYRK